MALCHGADYDPKITITMEDDHSFYCVLVVTHFDVDLTVYVVRRERSRRMRQPILVINGDRVVGRPISIELDTLHCAKDVSY